MNLHLLRVAGNEIFTVKDSGTENVWVRLEVSEVELVLLLDWLPVVFVCVLPTYIKRRIAKNSDNNRYAQFLKSHCLIITGPL